MSRNYKFLNPEELYHASSAMADCELWSNKVIEEKLNYVHYNPLEEGLVSRPEDYVYSSAIDYSGDKGMLDGVMTVVK